MLPFLVPMFETDATVRVAVEQSVQTSVTSLGTGGVMTGGDVAFDLRAFDPDVTYGLRAHAAYERLVSFAPGGGGPPADNLSADLGATTGIRLSPLTSAVIGADGFLATTWGVRAADELAARDPFTSGQRLEYAVGGAFGIASTLSKKSSLGLDFAYRQAGALWATDLSAVGVDTHAPRASLSTTHDVGPRDAITPGIRYEFTHFFHALQDVDLHRGPADVHAVTVELAESHEFGRLVTATAGGGVTAATPMPILKSKRVVVAPEARASVAYTGRRTGVTATYTFSYASLGPRIGYGQVHAATLRTSVRPADGSRWRGLMVHGIGRFSHGATPVAADPPLATSGAPAAPPIGTVTTTTVAAGGLVEVPLLRGLAATAGFDLAFVRALIDPAPPGGTSPLQAQAIVSVGLAWTASTDPRRTIPRDAAERRERPEPGPGERAEDRAREHRYDRPRPEDESKRSD